MTGSNIVVTLAAFVVLGVLLAGLWNMMRGGDPNTSQKLMRWRVWLQFLTIMLALAVIYLWRS